MAEPMPLILTDASVKISTDGTVANLAELACLASHIELSPDVATTTLETFCGTREYPGNVKWSLLVSLYQSFDADATEAILSAAVESGAPVAYEVVPYKGQPVSATNPAWRGEVVPRPYSPINGDAGEASAVEIEWVCTAPPVKSIVPAA